jgi:putative transcriptional regulator
MLERFPEKLRLLRNRHELSQQQLANHFGFSKNYVSALENGRKKPSLELAYKLSVLFQVTLDQLVRDDLDV